jgi:hypothetical protein
MISRVGGKLHMLSTPILKGWVAWDVGVSRCGFNLCNEGK